MRTDLAVFGYVGRRVSNATRAKVVDFTERLGHAVHMEVTIFEATSYEDLSKAIVSGYVDLAWLPPIPFMALDPRRAFSEERFFGSHEAVARAITRGVSDFGATYAGVDANGTLTRAPWLSLDAAEASRVRVLARVGGIPSDATVSSSRLPEATRDRFGDALLAMSRKPKNQPLLRRLFGIERFVRWQPAGYEEFRRKVDEAQTTGVLDVIQR